MIRMGSGYLVHVAYGDPDIAVLAVYGSIPCMNKFEIPNEMKHHIFFLSRIGIRSAKVLNFAASVNFAFHGIILISFSFSFGI